MAIHLERRRSAIEAKMKKEGINQTSNIYTLMDVTRVFGVHHHAVQLWIKKGLLHGRYAPLHRGRNRVWRFADGDIRNFIHDREPTAKWHWRAMPRGYWREYAKYVWDGRTDTSPYAAGQTGEGCRSVQRRR